jgi:hypothetical protein
MAGFIKIHRKIRQWEWFDDHNTFRLFICLMLKVNVTQKRWKGIVINRGQTVTSLAKLATYCGLSVQQTRTALSNLQTTREITCKSTNKFTLITLTNYGLYQDDLRKSTSKTTNNQQASQQTISKQVNKRATTTKECIKEERNNTPSLFEKSEPVTTKKNEKPKLNGWASWVDVNREYGRPDPAPVGPDLKAAKIIAVNALDRNDLENLYRMFLSDSDAFLAKQGHALRLMPGRINKYINVIEQQPAGFGSTDYEREIIEEIERKVTKQ